MGSFGWAGAAKGASDALQELLATKRAAYLQQQALERQAARETEDKRQFDVQTRQHDADLELRRTADGRAVRQAQLVEARAALDQADTMGPGTSLAPVTISALRGTPYEARLDEKTTIPGTLRAGDPTTVGMKTTTEGAGIPYTTLRQTQAQQQAAGDRSRLESLLTTLSPDARNLATLEHSGIRGLDIHDVEGTAAHQAHLTAEGRETEARANRIADYQHKLATTRDGQQAARVTARDNTLSQQDMLNLYRDAHTRAAADYRAMASESLDGSVTDEHGRPVTPDQLANAYVQNSLAALEALAAANPSPNKNLVTISGIRQRLPNGQTFSLNPPSQNQLRTVDLSTVTTAGSQAPKARGRTATAANVREMAKRSGQSEAAIRHQLAAAGVTLTP